MTEFEQRRPSPKADKREPAAKVSPKVSPEVSAQAVLESLASAVASASRRHSPPLPKGVTELKTPRTPQTGAKPETAVRERSSVSELPRNIRETNKDLNSQRPAARPETKPRPEQRVRLELVRGGEYKADPRAPKQTSRSETKPEILSAQKPDLQPQAAVKASKPEMQTGKPAPAAEEAPAKTAAQREQHLREGRQVRRDVEPALKEERKLESKSVPDIQAAPAERSNIVPFERSEKITKPEAAGAAAQEKEESKTVKAVQQAAEETKETAAAKRHEDRTAAAEAVSRNAYQTRIFEAQTSARKEEREDDFDDFFSRRKKRLRAAARKVQRKKALEQQKKRLAKLKKKRNGKPIRKARTLLKGPRK